MAALKSLLLRLKHDENTVGLNASKITVAIRSDSPADVLVSSPSLGGAAHEHNFSTFSLISRKLDFFGI